jgi:hypothetical protein
MQSARVDFILTGTIEIPLELANKVEREQMPYEEFVTYIKTVIADKIADFSINLVIDEL